MPWKTISRQELYEEVWSQAVSQLAPKYNLSDVGFAKLCKRCEIPRPPRGYWAKVQAGKKVKRTPLPSLDDEIKIRVHVPEPKEAEAIRESKMEAENSAAQLPVIEVADSLRGAHRLVSATRQSYEGAKTGSYGFLITPEDSKLDLSVSRDQLRRALLIPLEYAIDAGFHSLVKVLLEAGSEIVPIGTFCPMRLALDKRRLDMVELLVEHGYDPKCVDLRTVFETWDPAIMEHFIAADCDFDAGNPMAWALCERIRTALPLVKKYWDKFATFPARFAAALATMAHQNIACVLDRGDPDSGTPINSCVSS